MFLQRSLAHVWLCFVCLMLVSATAFAAEDWKPVDPAQLAGKTPVVDKDADAEAIFWEVRLNDTDYDLVFNHYIRIKIFTERGKESQSKIDIPYAGRYQIKDIAGRTIKPDGSIVELKKDSVFERTIVKLSGIKIQAKSFAMPGVEPGAIIEYRWREVRPNALANNVRLQFQRDIPVQSVTYYLRPAQIPGLGMSTMTFHGQNTPMVKGKDGFYSTTMTNMPAFREEPRMPPEDQVRTWMLIYYTRQEKPDPAKFWGDLGKGLYDELKGKMKVNDEVKKAAATIIGDASTPDEKLKRLFDFCRYKIKNLADDASGMTAEQRKKMKENKSPADTLKRGTGDTDDIDMLFAALATAAGFDSRLALSASRDDMFFDPKLPITYFIDQSCVAVRVGEAWRFFKPGSTYVAYGMLRWQEEGVAALVADSKEPKFVDTPVSTPDKSLESRTANLRLSEDGTLEGDVKIVYTGHLAFEKKEYNDDDSPEQRETTLREMMQSRIGGAEISNVRIENVTDPDKPFSYSFHIKAPGYAQRTGKRLFFQPSFFQHGIKALFSTSERRHSVYFHYPWSEEDTVMIDLPAGYALDNAEQPQSFNVDKIGAYEVSIGVTTDKRTLQYKRKFFFGGESRIIFQASTYPTLKRVFDAVHDADTHTIALKQGTGN
jgi:hypothetical protein